MKNKTLLISVFLLLSSTILIGQKKPAYHIFNKKGKSIKYDKMVKACAKADVIFFGELHNDPIVHWLEIELTKDVFDKKNGNITLGAEMFEADNQLILNEYLDGIISEKYFKKEIKIWPNYDTDYKPLVEFAKEKNLKFIATNIPRRYANIVYKKGLKILDSLTDEAKKYIAPLPIKVDLTVNAYKELAEMGVGHGAGENLAYAQAVKDATMGYFIYKNLEKRKTFIHYNGSYHSDNHESTVWFLKKLKKNLKVVVISSVNQDDIENLTEENKGVADFIICVPENMTKTR